MAMLSLLEAAKQVGKSKSSIWRAARSGSLSVTSEYPMNMFPLPTTPTETFGPVRSVCWRMSGYSLEG